jgi:hypothetical protein
MGDTARRNETLGRPRRKWVENIKMNLREIGWGGIDWIDLARDRDQWRALVNTIMNLRVQENTGKFLSSCTTGDLSERAELHGFSYDLNYFGEVSFFPVIR